MLRTHRNWPAHGRISRRVATVLAAAAFVSTSCSNESNNGQNGGASATTGGTSASSGGSSNVANTSATGAVQTSVPSTGGATNAFGGANASGGTQGSTGGVTTAASGVGGLSQGGTPGGGSNSTSSNTLASSGGTLGTGGSASGTRPSGGVTSVGGSVSTGATKASSTAGGSSVVVSCDASSPPPITRLGVETVVQSNRLNILVYVAQPPGSNDWYLVDALGYIYVYSNGVVQDTPFLDVSAELQNTTYESLNYDERGLLSIAFPPDYQTSGKFYVALIPTSTATEDHDLILEYKRSSSNPLVADTSTRKAILDLEPGGQDGTGYNPNTTGVDLNKYHNASTVLFGPDGMLYVGLGDGGGQCNSARPGVPQDITSPYGKILRFDPNAAPPYAAAGNPFASNGDPRVLHWGLRNPFRFNFDSTTGDLYIGDVGQWDYEEISYAPAGSKGLNFGWPDFEGNDPDACNTTVKLAAGATHTPPIATIAHPSGSGSSTLVYAIVAGTVYRGNAIPELYGTYLFGEYYANHDMRALYQCGSQTSQVVVIHKQCDLNKPNDPCFEPVGTSPQLAEVGAIVQGNDKELYLAANNNALLKVVKAP